MSTAKLKSDGLNLLKPDEITPEEIATYREFYRQSKGYSLPAFEFWLEFRPDVLKRYRLGVRETTSAVESARPLPHFIAMIHQYAIIGFDEGILYEIRLSQWGGATKAEILDTLAVAFIHASPRGMHSVARSSTDYLRNWQEPEPMDRWPESWSFDPHAFDSGMDFSSPAATRQDMDRLREWYHGALGEVPRYVRFLSEQRPGLLKAYRNRFEHAIRDGLPKEMMAYLLLNYNVSRGFHDGVREAVLLGKWLGMTLPQLVDAISWSFYYGGVDAFSIVEEAAGDILRKMG